MGDKIPALPDECRACNRSFEEVKRCISHGTHCQTCCPGGVETGKLPGKDRGDLPFETEKPEVDFD